MARGWRWLEIRRDCSVGTATMGIHRIVHDERGHVWRASVASYLVDPFVEKSILSLRAFTQQYIGLVGSF
jgi:hypothetical protein